MEVTNETNPTQSSLITAKQQLDKTTLPIHEEDGKVSVEKEALSKLRQQFNELMAQAQTQEIVANEWMEKERDSLIKQLIQVDEVCLHLDHLVERRQDLKGMQEQSVFPHIKEASLNWEQRVNISLIKMAQHHWSMDNLDILEEEVVGLLDAAQDLLNDVSKELDKVRQKVPRLFFLSNADVLELISTYQDPKELNKLIPHVFNFNVLVENENQIQGLVSNGETLRFNKPVSLKQDLTDLLNEIEQRMEEAVKQNGIECIGAIKKSDELDLLEDFTQQSILLAKKMKNTEETELDLKKGKVDEQKAREELRKYARLIVTQDLKQKDQNTLRNLIVYALHERDIAVSLARNSSTIDSIDWQMLARIYPQDQGNAVVRIAQAELPISYQFLRNSQRLVITPLTDKVYVSLSQAVVSHQIGANVGLAGVGKTETTKDLSNLLGRHSVVINCSEIISNHVVRQILRGGGGSGSWVILDDMQRLSVDAMSALARHAQQIFNALNQRKCTVSLDGTKDIQLRSTFSLFGSVYYSPQSEFLEPYKGMMQCMTLVMPDFTLLSEAMLSTEGFTQAESLAKIVFQVFDLAQATFSKQRRYDFGLRALKHVFGRAGSLLRRNPELNQSHLLRHVIEEIHLSKLELADAKLLNHILDSLFKEGVPSEFKNIDESLLQRIKESFAKQGITNSDYLVQKTQQLLSQMEMRHGLSLIGDAYSGKELVLKAASQATGAKVTTIYPKALTEEELFGSENGVVVTAMRAQAKAESEEAHWILFDGPIDPEWVESLNTLLDDNKKLILPTHEIIHLSASTRVLFNVENVLHATPATVSRLGIVYFQPDQITSQSRIDSFLAQSGVGSKELSDLQETIGLGLDFIKSAKLLISLSDAHLTENVLRILDAQLKQATGANDSLLFAMIWSLGSVISPEDRPRFDTFIRSLRVFQKSGFPKKASVFDVTLRREGHADVWKPWLDENNSSDYDSTSQTLESISQTEVTSLLVANNNPVLLVGPTATGKTISARSILKRLENSINTVELSLSKKTSPSEIRTVVQDLKSKTKKSVLFLDGLNLTQNTKYSSNPAQEALREIIGSDRSEGIAVIAAIDQSLKTQLSPSLLGHFAVIGYPELREESSRAVLSSLSQDASLIDATLQAYTLLNQKCEANFWNLRDLEAILKGVNSAQTEDPGRVWAHQAYHTFSDRLTEEEERQKVMEVIKEVAHSYAGYEIGLKRLLWAGIGPRDTQSYEEKHNLHSVRKEVQQAIASVATSEQDMLLLLSDEVLEHFLRIARALRSKDSHLLLKSEDPELSRTLTELVSKIMKIQCFSLNKQNASTIFRSVSEQDGTQYVLLVTQNNFGDHILAELHNIASRPSDESSPIHVVTIISPDNQDLSQQYPALVNRAAVDYFSGATKESVGMIVEEATDLEEEQTQTLIEILQANEPVRLIQTLHEVMGFKALYKQRVQVLTRRHEMTSEIIRLLPSAQLSKNKRSVLRSLKKDIEQINELDQSSTKSVLTVITDRIQTSVSIKDLQQLKALSSPPKEVAMLLGAVTVLLDNSKPPVKPTWSQARKMLNNPKALIQKVCSFDVDSLTVSKFKGLKKVTNDFNFTIERLKRVAYALSGFGQWVLAIRDHYESKEVEDKLVEQVKEEEEVKEENIEEISEEDRESMLQLMETAKESIDMITKGDITELKALKNPPVSFKLIVEALCYLFGVKPVTTMNQKTLKKEKDFYTPGMKMFGDMNFLKNLIQFDKDNVSKQTISKVKKVLNDPQCTEKRVMACSKAAYGIRMWMEAIVAYSTLLAEALVPKEFEEEAEEPKEEEEESVEEVKEEEELQYTERTESLMEKAVQNLNSLKLSDLTELKAYKKPPVAVILVMEGICYLFKIKPVLVMNQTTFKKEKNYWPPSQRLLGDQSFLKRMIEYDKDNMSLQLVQKVRKILAKPECSEQKVEASSKAAYGLRIWLQAIVQFASLKARAASPKHYGEEEADEEIVPQEYSKLQVEKEIVQILEHGSNSNRSLGDLRTLLKEWLHSIELQKARAAQQAIQKLKGKRQSSQEEDHTLLKQEIITSVLAEKGVDFHGRKQILSYRISDIERQQFEISERLLGVIRQRMSRTDLILFESLSESILSLESEKQLMRDEEREVDAQIQNQEDQFEELAKYGSSLLVCVKELRRLNRFYSFSEKHFIRIVKRLVEEKAKAGDTNQANLKKELLERVHGWVNSGLFEDDRFLFSFLLIMKLETDSLDADEFKFLVQPYGETTAPNSTKWLDNATWKELCWLSELPHFSGLSEAVSQNSKQWNKLLDRDEPHQYKLPGVWRQRLNQFHFLLVLRVLRPQKLPLAIESLVSNLLGEQLQSDHFQGLEELVKHNRSPIVLNVKEQARAEGKLRKLAHSLHKNLHIVYATEDESINDELKRAARKGEWIYFANNQAFSSNCLAKLGKLHPGFRVFIKANSNLQQDLMLNSSKFTIENPFRFNEVLVQSLENPSFRVYFESASSEFRNVIAITLLLHTTLTIQQTQSRSAEIQKFNLQDLDFALQTISHWNQSSSSIQTLRYLLGDIVYGGKVVDESEKATIKANVGYFFPDNVLTESALLKHISPPLESFEQFQGFLLNWAQQNQDPLGVFSASQRAFFNQQKVKKLLSNAAIVLTPAPFHQMATIQAILAELPALRSIHLSSQDILSIQIEREIGSYQSKIKQIRSELLRLKTCLKRNEGLSLVDEEKLCALERGDMLQEWINHVIFFQIDKVSDALSLLRQGLNYFQSWARQGQPQIVNLNYFLEPRDYLKSLSLSYSVNKGVSLEDIEIKITPCDEKQDENIVASVCVLGGAWNSTLRELQSTEGDASLTLALSLTTSDESPTRNFLCPWKNEARRGSPIKLVGNVEINTRKEEEEDLRRRGVAFTLNRRI